MQKHDRVYHIIILPQCIFPKMYYNPILSRINDTTTPKQHIYDTTMIAPQDLAMGSFQTSWRMLVGECGTGYYQDSNKLRIGYKRLFRENRHLKNNLYLSLLLRYKKWHHLVLGYFPLVV